MNDSITSRIPVEPGKGCQHLLCVINHESRIANGVYPVGTLFKCEDWLKAERKEAKRNRKRQVRREQNKPLDLDRLNELKAQIDDGREPTDIDEVIALDALIHNFNFSANTGKLPALLERDDGETVLYANKWNTIYGTPGGGKSWISLIAMKDAILRGGHVLLMDFDDNPQTFKRRSLMLGFDPMDYADSFMSVDREFIDHPDAIPYALEFLGKGEGDFEQSLVVIDSAEAAGCPSDGGNVNPWIEKFVNPWRRHEIGILVVDHIAKRADEDGNRPRGGIGATRKFGAIDGVALLVTGVPWTKKTGGRLMLTNHKDRGGDIPVPVPQKVAAIVGSYDSNGGFDYQVIAPSPQDDSGDIMAEMLVAISEAGQDGVTGQKAKRELVKGKASVVDIAMNALIEIGFVGQNKVGRSINYTITQAGQKHLEETN